jgi:type I restriction enzyme S subunit
MKADWQRKKVSEIATHSLGKMLDKAKNKGEPKPYLRNLNVRWFGFDLSDVLEMRFLPEEAARYTAVKGDVLVCEGGYPGRAAIWEQDDPIYFQKALHRVRFHEPKRAKWFLYYLLSKDLDGTLNDHFNGAGIQHFTGEVLAQFQVPLPPLIEQERIVNILDEAFAGLAAAKANAEKNLQNARAIFDSYLQSVFTQCGASWVENKLKLVTTKIGSGATPRGGEQSYKEYGISLIRSLNVHDLGFRYSKLAFLDDVQAGELSNVEVQPRDVLLNITGASVARCCVVPDDVLPARVNQHVSILRPVANKLDAAFLHYLLISKPYKDKLLQTGEDGGSTRQAITKAQILEFSVAYPKRLEEQVMLVAKLDAVLVETQRLESLYQRKLAALDALKQSLLHKAFSGQL